MSKDVIVEEVRRIREKIAARHDFDINRIFAEAQINQKQRLLKRVKHNAA